MKKLLFLFMLFIIVGSLQAQDDFYRLRPDGKFEKVFSGTDSSNTIDIPRFTIGNPRTFSRDTSFSNAKDTAIYNFKFKYYKGYVDIYNPNASADSFAVEIFNPISLSYTPYGFGLRNTNNGDYEADNSVVIIPAATTIPIINKYEITYLRPGQIRVRSLSTKTRASKVRIGFTGVN